MPRLYKIFWLASGVAKEPYGPYSQRPHMVHSVDHKAKSLISPFSCYVAALGARQGLESIFLIQQKCASQKLDGSLEILKLFHPHQQCSSANQEFLNLVLELLLLLQHQSLDSYFLLQSNSPTTGVYYGTRLKQLRIEPAQVIVEIFTNIWFP